MESTNNITLSDFSEQWMVVVNKALGDFNSLTAPERIWFTVQALMQAVDNGGFFAHYCNYGADYHKETIESLMALDLPEVAEMLHQMDALFPDGIVPKDIEARNEIMSNWDGEAYDYLDDFLEKLDNQFYSWEPEIEAQLIDLITTQIIIAE